MSSGVTLLLFICIGALVPTTNSFTVTRPHGAGFRIIQRNAPMHMTEKARKPAVGFGAPSKKRLEEGSADETMNESPVTVVDPPQKQEENKEEEEEEAVASASVSVPETETKAEAEPKEVPKAAVGFGAPSEKQLEEGSADEATNESPEPVVDPPQKEEVKEEEAAVASASVSVPEAETETKAETKAETETETETEIDIKLEKEEVVEESVVPAVTATSTPKDERILEEGEEVKASTTKLSWMSGSPVNPEEVAQNKYSYTALVKSSNEELAKAAGAGVRKTSVSLVALTSR